MDFLIKLLVVVILTSFLAREIRKWLRIFKISTMEELKDRLNNFLVAHPRIADALTIVGAVVLVFVYVSLIRNLSEKTAALLTFGGLGALICSKVAYPWVRGLLGRA